DEFSLEVLPDGNACLERMARGGVDVLLLDMNLPGVDGLTILGKLAARRDPTPVIMVSAQAQTELAVKALRAGAVDCIEKISPQLGGIVDLVKSVYERREKTRRLDAVLPPLPDSSHEVFLVEASEDDRRRIVEFLQANAPHVAVRAFGTPGGL